MVNFLAVLFQNFLLLLHRVHEELSVAEEVGTGPGGSYGASVLTGKEGGYEEAGHFTFTGGTAVFVFRIDEALQHVFFWLARGFAGLDDSGEDLSKAGTGAVALAVSRDGEVGEDHADGLHAVVKVVEEGGHIVKQLLTNFSTEQASACS